MKRPRLAVLALFAVLVTTLSTSVSASANGRDDRDEHTYYLSLGDSLAQGVQPNAAGVSVVTNQGYPDQLFKMAREEREHLTLVKMGCPRETTTTMVAGGICPYARVSQLNDAVDFLTAHRNHVAFVTLDIGANDINGCAVLTPSGPSSDPLCIAAALSSISAKLPVIVASLRAVDPSTVIVGMNYYNPTLAVWLQPGGSLLYYASLILAHQFNALLGGIYGGAGLPVADVATAFSSDVTTPVPFSPPLPAGATAPLNVVRICQWTWMCAPAPVGPNTHANKAGYAVIARVFAARLGLGVED
jgi:lysophospholipase L1-like esterase